MTLEVGIHRDCKGIMGGPHQGSSFGYFEKLLSLSQIQLKYVEPWPPWLGFGALRKMLQGLYGVLLGIYWGYMGIMEKEHGKYYWGFIGSL